MATNPKLDLAEMPASRRGSQSSLLSSNRQRIPALDFTKGALVLFMVLYHWLNYFYGPEGKIYSYLRFLTPSFIFITGFLISHVHFARYEFDASKLAVRLFSRGVKLLLLFAGLNALVGLLVPSSFIRSVATGQAVAANLNAIFLVGNASGGEGGKIAAFGILVPIGYLLILSSLLLVVRRFFKFIFVIVCALSLACMAFLNLRHIEYPNLELVAVGLLGIVLGYASGNQLQKLVKKYTIVAVLYCLYLVAITFWKVSYYVQIVGACLTTTLIYVLGVHAGSGEPLQSRIILLGKYSLFGYISQIAILRLLSACLRRISYNPAVLTASLVAGFALTLLAVEVMDRLRMRYRMIDTAYKWIFA